MFVERIEHRHLPDVLAGGVGRFEEAVAPGLVVGEDATPSKSLTKFETWLIKRMNSECCPGHFLAEALDTRRLFSINSIHYDDTTKLDTFDIFNIPDLKDAKKVVILDDIVDSGETMREILKLLGSKYPQTGRAGFHC